MKNNNYFIFRFFNFFKKYGFWSIILMSIAIISILSGLIVAFLFIQKLSLFYNIPDKNEIDSQTTSMVGNFFGGVVGTIWSFSGVILFFLALRLQSRELNLQIVELKNTREVFSIQQFENTFFNLLKTQNDIRIGIEYKEVIKPGQTHEFYLIPNSFSI